MAAFVQAVRILFLVAIICCGANAPSLALEVGASGTDQVTAVRPRNGLETRDLPRLAMLTPGRKEHAAESITLDPEPFGRRPMAASPSEISARWAELHSRILSEEKTLAACRSGEDTCPTAARQFLHIIELGQQRQGRARLGEINRAVNLSIKPIREWARQASDDFWLAPIAALNAGVGDCKDYAIVKYVALRESGIAPDDLRFVIVRDIRLKMDHAVVAVRLDEQWLVLDNRTLIMANAAEVRHYHPLFVLDDWGAGAVATATLR
jgi:predicted transglutaminase-like cysteine proteinase